MSASSVALSAPQASWWHNVRNAFRGIPLIPLAIVVMMVLSAAGADFLAPYNPELGNLRDRNKPPLFHSERTGNTYLLGSDHQGRDVLSRLLYGARISLLVAFTTAIVAGCIGTVIGIIAGYVGGWVDHVVMRLVDTWLAIPAVSFAILLAVILQKPSEYDLIIVLSVVYWTRYARVVRGEVLSLKERDYVRLALCAGCSKWRIMAKHILPNVLNTAVVLATLLLGVVIVAEASLSFLGLGVPPPKPAWGLMLADGKDGMLVGYWWLTLFPGIAIMLMVLAANLLGDWLRVRLDPQLKQL